jgi:hypothetical protein
MSKKLDKARLELAHAESRLAVSVEILGDLIALQNNWRDAKGYDAIVIHLVKKHNWLPTDIRSMNKEDLQLVLVEEFEQHAAGLRQRLGMLSDT